MFDTTVFLYIVVRKGRRQPIFTELNLQGDNRPT